MKIHLGAAVVCTMLGMVLTTVGCGKKEAAVAPAEMAHKHEHHPPHGGTPVVLGDEVYHLEFVIEPSAGKMKAYLLDGEMENFIRSAVPSFEVVATVGGQSRRLGFNAVADAATGEKVGDTSLFEAQADWLKTSTEFDGVITTLTIRGSTFANIAFKFPQGNEKDTAQPEKH